MRRPSRRLLTLVAFSLMAGTVAWVARDVVVGRPTPVAGSIEASAPNAGDRPAEGAAGAEHSKSESGKKPLHQDTRVVSEEQRQDALARAQVWRQPAVPIREAYFGPDANPPTDLTCKFTITELGGTTPKFDCTLESGEQIRIKYGKGPEIPAEAAATRLLSGLGFGADGISLVKHLRCYGCPEEPFSTMKAVEITRAEPLYKHVVDYSKYEDFDWVALERKFTARPIETEKQEGWAFFELDLIDPAKGGASREQVDGLRLITVLLAHWDNKAENQRLVCLSHDWPANTLCKEPFLLLQDVGATYGPTKVNLEAWAKAPMWDDRAECRVSMRELPYDGATFGEARVTERGRQFAGSLLRQLSDRQLADLFAGARFDKARGIFSATWPVAEWVRVFKAKVQAITEGPACPA
jgi:hypothetical protein